jgi:hypothetical protein
MWITGAEWCDFVSFDPRLGRGLRLHIQRVERDQSFIDNLEVGVRSFLADVDLICTTLMEKSQ